MRAHSGNLTSADPPLSLSLDRRRVLRAMATAPFLALRPRRAQAEQEDLDAFIARTLIVGFEGDRYDAPGFEALCSLAERYPIGGVIYMGRNIRGDDEVWRMNATLRSRAKASLFVSVDEEGGSVRRLRRLGSIPATPAARDVARVPPEVSLDVYARLASALAHLGFDLNFGPVVDLALNPANAAIVRPGRSYGADPYRVAAHAISFIRAHRDFGVHVALKHFPGHGSVTDDPHDVPVDATATWAPVELEPFRLVLERVRPSFLMTSHQILANARIRTPPGVPVTFSPEAVAVAREDLRFSGLIVSDDLSMGAISASHSPARATAGALLAGHDCVILANPGTRPMRVVVDVIASVARIAHADPVLRTRVLDAGAAVDRVLRAS